MPQQKHLKRSGSAAGVVDRSEKANCWYAVVYGHSGPKVYDNLQDAQKEVTGLSGGFFKGHPTLQEAKAWLAEEVELRLANLRSFQQLGQSGVEAEIEGASDPTGPSAPTTESTVGDVDLSAQMPGALPPANDRSDTLGSGKIIRGRPRRSYKHFQYPQHDAQQTYAFGLEPPGQDATASQLHAFFFPPLEGQIKRDAGAAQPTLVRSEPSVSARPSVPSSGLSEERIEQKSGPSTASTSEARTSNTPAASTPARKGTGSSAQSPAAVTPRIPASPPTAETIQQDALLQESEREITLSPQQEAIRKLVVESCENICITGGGGTGKSVLMRRIVRDCKRLYGEMAVATTATTGIAALNIGGSTIHAWAGIGLGNELPHVLAAKIEGSARLRAPWLRCRVLLIDEVSMLDCFLFDKLDYIGKKVRRQPNQPFGGIQLVLVGDFFQLPPIVNVLEEPARHLTDTKSTMVRAYNAKRKQYRSAYCFDADGWAAAVPQNVTLNQVFRQSDNHLVQMLEEVRRGRMRAETADFFLSLQRPLPHSEFVPTQLYPTRAEVEKCNQAHLQALKARQHWFRAVDQAAERNLASLKDLLDKKTLAQSDLYLKVGSQVMLIVNMPTKTGAPPLVNGSRGIVVGFAGTNGVRASVDDEGDATITTYAMESEELGTSPVKLEVAHATRDGLGKGGSTALVPTISGNPNPIIRFANGRELLIPPCVIEGAAILPAPSPVNDLLHLSHRFTFKHENPATATLVASRTQLPLILAWGLSIHKAQGMTLDRMIVDLGRTFENGQAYVALSRCTTASGLQVLNFDERRIMTDARVLEWERTTTTEVKASAAPHPRAPSINADAGHARPPAVASTAAPGASSSAIGFSSGIAASTSALGSNPVALRSERVLTGTTDPTPSPSQESPSASSTRLYPDVPAALELPWWERAAKQEERQRLDDLNDEETVRKDLLPSSAQQSPSPIAGSYPEVSSPQSTLLRARSHGFAPAVPAGSIAAKTPNRSLTSPGAGKQEARCGPSPRTTPITQLNFVLKSASGSP